MYDAIVDIYTNALDEDERERYADEIEMYAEISTQGIIDDMRKYVHRKDTRMSGNFCDIREDWEYTSGFIGSDVEPWGKFDDMVKSMDDETINDEDLEKVQQWCQDWFFRAFGTWGLSYNFQTCIAELEYEYD